MLNLRQSREHIFLAADNNNPLAGRERSAQPRPQTPNCYVAVTVESSAAEYSGRISVPWRGITKALSAMAATERFGEDDR
jgi:hypothetical protein